MDWAAWVWLWCSGTITASQTVYLPGRNTLAQISLARFVHPGINYAAYAPEGSYQVYVPPATASAWISELVDANGTRTFGPGFDQGPSVLDSPACRKLTFNLSTTAAGAYATALVYYV